VHTKAALRAGETTQRPGVLAAWRDTELFTTQERAALALA
jgi:alkylhydroperoxidase family enzyme